MSNKYPMNRIDCGKEKCVFIEPYIFFKYIWFYEEKYQLKPKLMLRFLTDYTNTRHENVNFIFDRCHCIKIVGRNESK